jgi:hypothetical protein
MILVARFKATVKRLYCTVAHVKEPASQSSVPSECAETIYREFRWIDSIIASLDPYRCASAQPPAITISYASPPSIALLRRVAHFTSVCSVGAVRVYTSYTATGDELVGAVTKTDKILSLSPTSALHDFEASQTVRSAMT